VSPVITQADRAGWQRRAASELARILEGHPELACITWTVGPAGSVITGRVSGLAPSRQVRQVFRAWQRALGLGEGHQTRGGGGTAWLHAADRSGKVTIRLTAAVLGEREDA
jgi:surface antigen